MLLNRAGIGNGQLLQQGLILFHAAGDEVLLRVIVTGVGVRTHERTVAVQRIIHRDTRTNRQTLQRHNLQIHIPHQALILVLRLRVERHLIRIGYILEVRACRISAAQVFAGIFILASFGIIHGVPLRHRERSGDNARACRRTIVHRVASTADHKAQMLTYFQPLGDFEIGIQTQREAVIV